MLRDFQRIAVDGVYSAWGEPNVHNVILVAPTGAGKTVMFSEIIKECGAATCLIAHRQELVSQASLALNREGVPHMLISPKPVISQVIALHHTTHGYTSYQHRARVRVASVDTLIGQDRDRWYDEVGLVVHDEAHHLQIDNKWGTAHLMFPNARGLGVTAHAVRADGGGLGRVGGNGLFDRIVLGPSCRELINRGYLTDYRLLCPPNDIDFSHVPISPTTGDYMQPQLRAATHGSNRIVGDVVKHYLGYAAGKLGITFAVDVDEAKKLAAAYRAAGVPAEVITGKTPIAVRGQLMKQFRERRLLQLVAVDCLSEGTDVPAVEVVSLARRTASWQLYCQQIGRALRPMLTEDEARAWGSLSDTERLARIAASGKPKAIVIDHVGNVPFHAAERGLPDSPQEYTLLNRVGGVRKKNGPSSVRTCAECLMPYERFLLKCPHCGEPYIVMGRSTPDEVEGDLIELDPAVLQALRSAVARVDAPVFFPKDAGRDARTHIFRSHLERVSAKNELVKAISLWGGWREHVGEPERQAQKRFYLTFGVDVLSAQTLSAEAMQGLESRIRENLARNNIVEGSECQLSKRTY